MRTSTPNIAATAGNRLYFEDRRRVLQDAKNPRTTAYTEVLDLVVYYIPHQPLGLR